MTNQVRLMLLLLLVYHSWSPGAIIRRSDLLWIPVMHIPLHAHISPVVGNVAIPSTTARVAVIVTLRTPLGRRTRAQSVRTARCVTCGGRSKRNLGGETVRREHVDIF